MDDESFESLKDLNLPKITVIHLRELEECHPALLKTKDTRTKVEYYYTCGPSYILYVLQHYPYVDLITYLDADLYFFSDPEPILDEMDGHSVGIIEHRFSKRQQKLKRFGNFNVGWLSFRHDEAGLECLRWWADRCMEWCYDRLEGDKFADQKYLDEFPLRFKSVRVVEHNGANLAPWNLGNFSIAQRDGQIVVNDQPLIFFHFHGFKMLNSWLFDTNMGGYHSTPSKLVQQRIFGPYIRELREVGKRVGPADTLREVNRSKSRGYGTLLRVARAAAQAGFGILRRSYIISFSTALH